MKLYKVPLYQVNYVNKDIGKLTYIEDIIVKKRMFIVREVVTGYSIDITNQYRIKDGRLDYYYMHRDMYERDGYHLVIYYEDLDEKHLVKEKELEDYLSNYDNSNWNKIYQEINQRRDNTFKRIKRFIKKI